MKPDTAQHIIDALVIISVLLAAVVLSGCDPRMTNDEIIAEVKKCKDADLIGQVIFDKQQRYVVGVQCITKIKESLAGPAVNSEA